MTSIEKLLLWIRTYRATRYTRRICKQLNVDVVRKITPDLSVIEAVSLCAKMNFSCCGPQYGNPLFKAWIFWHPNSSFGVFLHELGHILDLKDVKFEYLSYDSRSILERELIASIWAIRFCKKYGLENPKKELQRCYRTYWLKYQLRHYRAKPRLSEIKRRVRAHDI